MWCKLRESIELKKSCNRAACNEREGIECYWKKSVLNCNEVDEEDLERTEL